MEQNERGSKPPVGANDDGIVIDGVSYPCHINLINAIRRSSPALLKDESDANKVRKWLRENMRKDDDETGGWIGHLWAISNMLGMMKAYEKHPDKWPLLSTETRKAKAEKIFKLITDLIEALEDDDLPFAPEAAYNLFDSYGFFIESMDLSLLIHEYAIRNKKKVIYKESTTDLLRTLIKRYQGIEKCGIGYTWAKKNKGIYNYKIRESALNLVYEVNRRYRPEKPPYEIIAAMLSITFPEQPVTNEHVRKWHRSENKHKK